MQGISIFQQIYAPRVAHVVTGFDGVSHNTHSPYAIGGVVGSTGKMTAIVANDQADTWHIVNLKCGKIFDAVAVLGAFDESEAANMAMRYHGQYFDAVCGDVCESNTGGLQRFLNHPVYMRTNRPVYAEELAKLQDIPSTQAILWDGVQLKSHNGSSKHLLLDMMRCDDDKALLEKMDFVEEESQLDGEIAEYDALVVEAYKLESTVSKLALAMDKATSISTLKVAKQTLSKPKTMRGFGVIQQLVSFELSDGQAVSIIFNVSDSEANASAKMTKDDLLVAWKYKLNSRDITAAVQPNATQNVSLNMIASRIMGLADANSEKFVAAQKKKDAMQTELADTNQRVKDLQGQEQALLQEIADLQKQLDEKAKNKALQEAESRAEIEGMGKDVQSAPQDRPTDLSSQRVSLTDKDVAEMPYEQRTELDARIDSLSPNELGYLGVILNYKTSDKQKIANDAKQEHPDYLKTALESLDKTMAQEAVRKKIAEIGKQPNRDDALALAVKFTKEMPNEAERIRIELYLAISQNKWKGIEVKLPQQPPKLKTDAEVLASVKRLQKSFDGTEFRLNISKANTDFIRGTLIKGSGSSMSSQEFSYFNNKGFDLGYIEYGNQFNFDTFNLILKGIEKWLQGDIIPKFYVGTDVNWDMDSISTPLKIKEALDKALSEGLAMQQPSEPEPTPTKISTLQQYLSKSELFKDKNVWAIDDFGKENGMVIYSRDEQDGFSIGIVDKLKQVNMQYTDIDTDQQTNESFSTENITNEQVIEKIKMFIAKYEQNSVELSPVQPISEPPVVEQDNAEKNMTAADFLALGGKEWVKDDMTRIYINAKVFNDLMGTSFGDSNNKFFFDVNTSALMRSYKGKKPQVEKQYEPVQQQSSEPVSEPPMTNPDRDYLQSIIDGDVDPLIVDMDAVIALAKKYDGDAEITPLLDQALEVINQAEQEAAKGI